MSPRFLVWVCFLVFGGAFFVVVVVFFILLSFPFAFKQLYATKSSFLPEAILRKKTQQVE